MNRTLQDEKLIIASHNPGKVREISQLLGPFGSKVTSAAHLNLPEPEETGTSFIDNALIKAKSAAFNAKYPALADDSGLAITALNGAPGIFSARWAGPSKDFSQAMQKVNKELSNHKDKSASFVCALVLCWPDGHHKAFEGFIHGHICWPPRGTNGFGYDPIFIPYGFDQTFAQIKPEIKQSISHRANAFKQLVKYCFKE